MMTTKKLPLILAAIFITVLVGAGTIALLRQLYPRNDASESITSDPPTEVSDALSLEDEANALLHTDPAKAQEKFSEAERLHIENGDDAAASEARRNAASAAAAHNSLKSTEDQVGEGVIAEADGPTQ